MARKTVDITTLIEIVNRRNRGSTCSPEVREGWNSLLEQVLMNADVYSGFGHLEQAEVPEDQLPGIIFDRSGRGQHQFPDESRKCYYTHKKLLATTKVGK